MRHPTNLHLYSTLRLPILFLIASLMIVSSAGCQSAPDPLTQPAPASTSAPITAPVTEPTAAVESSPTSEPAAAAEITGTAESPAASGPTATPKPGLSASPTVPARDALPVLGGADQVAFFSNAEVWTANIDGSILTQLTQDGRPKTYLRWLPNGEGLTYISDTCIHSVSLAGAVETITCFKAAKLLESFEVSPDGQRLALSLDSQLYLLPFDLEALRSADGHSDLQAMATCADLAPYQPNTARTVRWSSDSNRLAAVVMGKLKTGKPGDVVQVFSVDDCVPNPLISVRFPDQHFTYLDYNRNPTFQDFAWDGADLFILHSRNEYESFSAMHMFNIETFNFTENINPVGGACCYRDPQFSPDGSYLIFAFQDNGAGASKATRLYYIPVESIGSGETYQPLPIPEITDPNEQPQPALRPAQP